MSFGKAFKTLAEARAYLKTKHSMYQEYEKIRKMPKKLHPRRKKLYHVGTHLEYINFA